MSDKLSAFGGVWNRPARGIGVTTLWIVIVACFFPNLYLYLVHGAWPGWGAAFQAWLMIVSICGAVYFIEPISYFPVLGEVGIYIAFLTGNIGNLRVPCSAAAQEAVGTESGSPEALIVSTVGLTGSVVINLFFVTLAAVAGASVLSVLPAGIVSAFKSCAVPAVFGAMFVSCVIKEPLLAVPGIGIPGLLFASGRPALQHPATLILGAVFGTIVTARVLYKAGIIKK